MTDIRLGPLMSVQDAWVESLYERGYGPLSRTLEHATASGELLLVDYAALRDQADRGELPDPGPLPPMDIAAEMAKTFMVIHRGDFEMNFEPNLEQEILKYIGRFAASLESSPLTLSIKHYTGQWIRRELPTQLVRSILVSEMPDKSMQWGPFCPACRTAIEEVDGQWLTGVIHAGLNSYTICWSCVGELVGKLEDMFRG